MPIKILKKDKNKSDPKKRFDPRTGEETNKPGGKDPRTIYRPQPDVKPTEMRTGGLSPKQKKIAAKAPPPNKITGEDFAVLKKEKAKGRGMGLQDESIKPGKVQKAFLGKMIKGAGKSVGRLFGRKQSATATPGAMVSQKASLPINLVEEYKKAKGLKVGGVMKANKGKMTPLKKDPTTPVNPFEKRRKQLGGGRSKLPGKIGTALGIGAMMVPAAYAAAKQYKDYKSAKNRDKAKVKKYSLGGDILTQFKDIMTGSKDSKISKAKEGLKKQIAEGRAKMRDKAKVKKYSKGMSKEDITREGKRGIAAGKALGESLRDKNAPMKRQRLADRQLSKKMGGGMMRRYSKGGGADTGKVGEIKSKISVAMDRASRRSRDKDRLTQRDIDFLRRRSRNEDRITDRDMQRPMGYDYGGKVKTKPASKERKPEGIKDDTFDPIMKKPEGMKKELAIIQTEDAISRKNIGDGKKMTRRGLMKVVDAAADDRQLGRSLRKFERDVFKTGGSVMARGCKLGRTKKTKLY